jgi:hypothetical protein
MPYLAGIVLGIFVCGFARFATLDRDRAFYPTVLIVIASYYVLFATMGGSTSALVSELVPMALFFVVATFGIKGSQWILVIGITGHGLFDAVHGMLITNPGMPAWWPAFCGSIDVTIGVILGAMLLAKGHNSRAVVLQEAQTSSGP